MDGILHSVWLTSKQVNANLSYSARHVTVHLYSEPPALP